MNSDPIHVYYADAFVAGGYAFDTTRKAGWIADSLLERPIAGVRIIAPGPLTEAQLVAVHAPEYVRAVKSGTPRHLAESSGFEWDPAVWDAVRSSNGGAAAAARRALITRRNAGSLSSGLHHARRASGAAFCTFNGLALAARAALDAGAARVLILDLDAHIGDGTLEILGGWTDVMHVDMTVCPWGAPSGDPSRSSLDVIRAADGYLPALTRRLEAIDAAGIDLCIYNAGMDPHEDSDIGGLEGITTDLLRERERTVFSWAAAAAVPVAFVLAGGYAGGSLTRDALVHLHRMTIDAAAGTERPEGDMRRSEDVLSTPMVSPQLIDRDSPGQSRL